GVGVYFVTQNPADIPEKVLAQLGNRVQHALRAYTPQEQKGVKAAATSFRVNPKLDTETVITELGVGEVLISMLDEKGVPAVVDRVFVVPPVGHIGPITPEQRQALIANSLVAGVYENAIDRESAFEMLKVKNDAKLAEQQQAAEAAAAAKQQEDAAKAERTAARAPDTVWESIGKSAVRAATTSVARSIGTKLVRGVLGSLLGGKKSWF
ncbi:MAG: helicase HerA-like domain-containing protein, partial [Acidobacteriota bacterium]